MEDQNILRLLHAAAVVATVKVHSAYTDSTGLTKTDITTHLEVINTFIRFRELVR